MRKLIRDRIPEIARARGAELAVEEVNDDGVFGVLLQEKLREETYEYLALPSPEELADILEVIETLARRHNCSFRQLRRIQAKKRRDRGGFAMRLVLQTP